MVNDDATTATATPEKPVAAGETTAPTGVEADIMDSIPKPMNVKAKKLVDRLKTQLSWTDRGELLYDGTPVPGRNMVDLVNDVLQKRRKSDPVGWQAFAQQLKRINLPMELVGNVERIRYIRQAATTLVAVTPRNRPLPRWTPYSRWQVEQSKSPRKKRHRRLPSLVGWESF